jgi:hypothetical protein
MKKMKIFNILYKEQYAGGTLMRHSGLHQSFYLQDKVGCRQRTYILSQG